MKPSQDTRISLQELSNSSHPLLKRLGLEAPGTYHHSLIVARLAEAAAEALGADRLLTRVGACFHDIGKLARPAYFVENEGAQGSLHDTLSPRESALIIVAHVKDGANLAEEQRLPAPIADIIRQHHGTSLMEWFYRQSRAASPGDPASEQTFRYPGPKPKTREAAIILLADAVEAASRTLPDPSPSRIQALVHEVALRKVRDGQLNESPLTLTDLAKVEKCFARALTACFQSRPKPAAPNAGQPADSSHSAEHNGRPGGSP